MKLYFDMDGVLADFAAAANKLDGFREDLNQATKNMTDEQREAKKKYWLEIEQISDFWSGMKPIQDVEQVLELAQKIGELFILTKTPSANKFVNGQEYVNKIADAKRQWIKKHFSKYFEDKNVIVCSGKKGDLINPDENCILIDDRTDNIEQWCSCGGTGVLFVSPEDACMQLTKIGKF